jgi:hypothetical protein
MHLISILTPLIFWLLTYWKRFQKSDDFSKEIISKSGKLGPFFFHKNLFVCVIFLRLKKNLQKIHQNFEKWCKYV